MKAIKGNKVYTIDETQTARYTADGFDITDGDGEIIEHARGKTVPYETYQAVVDELEGLKEKKGTKKSTPKKETKETEAEAGE